ncbi:MAG: TIGR02757 family protein [Acidobacteria bacterium]|nr:TIGR02757 family protein [Acidobacteriota bacterium]
MSCLKATLDEYFENFRYRDHLCRDPVQFVYRWQGARDREVAGLLAAALAYGNVTQILNSLERLFGLMGKSPHQFVLSFSQAEARSLRNFYHRFNTGRDIAALCLAVQRALLEFGSLENLFLAGNEAHAATIEQGLCRFVDNLRQRIPARVYHRKSLPEYAGVRFLLPSPAAGSACKRMNLFLRWMIRPGPVDLRLWTRIHPRQLVLPVDTHVARIGRYIGLTRRRDVGWKTALEMTETLRSLNPDDPVRYDFALCHLGIMRGCPARRSLVKCACCPIQRVCTL